MRALPLTLSAAFVAVAAGIFVLGSEWDDGPAGLFVVWLAAHLAYGAAVATFRALPVTLLVPLAIAPLPWQSGEETAYWTQAAFAELFYGIPFVFIGVVGRRLWQARRPATLPPPPDRGERPG